MDFTFEALSILVVLLPGFLSSALLDHVVVRRGRDNVQRVVEALVFSFVIYAVLLIVLGPPVHPLPMTAGELARFPLSRVFVGGSLLLSILLPSLLGLLITTDWHMKLLRRLRVTNKTSRETTWLDVFSEQQRYVIVNLSGNRRVFGWPMYFSSNRDEGLLYLYDPAWVNDDGTYTALDLHGLFLVEPDTIESIEFTQVTRQNAKLEVKNEEPAPA
ncbi:MAG TPA: DUF6338 family protein [Thermoanaerobaculia bacterium]|nr:DUF6338 family protein [Thermoanaerobaculia bacterium]